VRQLRALLRHRVQLVRLRTLLRNRIRAVLAGHGHHRPGGYWSSPGRQWLASLELPAVSREVVEDDLALIDALEATIDRLDWEVHQRAPSDPRIKVLTQLPGVWRSPRWAGVSLQRAPPGPFEASACRPPAPNARRQRFADIRVTRKRRAISRSLAPASISSAAASRTRSRRARSSAVSSPQSGYLITPA
jgi:hypothetical protein